MRILALTWPTFDDERLMINARGDLICPATDGIVNELLNLGHQVVYVNVAAEEYDFSEKELSCPAFISGLPMKRWADIKDKDFTLIWHDIKDPTPPKAVDWVNKITAEFEGVPVLNPVNSLKDHTKKKYIGLMREKNVGAIILNDYKGWLKENGQIDLQKCHPPSNGAYVSLDYEAIRLSNVNSQRIQSLLSDEGGITLKYHRTELYPGADRALKTFFRVPYAAGKCLEGMKYHCPSNILCPKSGAALKTEAYSIPDMTAGTISAAMTELGVDIAHVEGVEAGFTVEVFDVNPFPSSHGASLTPLSKRIAKRLEQVYQI